LNKRKLKLNSSYNQKVKIRIKQRSFSEKRATNQAKQLIVVRKKP